MFSYFRKLVETIIKRGRLRSLQSTDDNQKTKPKDFWKHVLTFKKNEHVVAQLKSAKI
jgi:hypothetical protein